MRNIKHLVIFICIAATLMGCIKPSQSLFYSYNQQPMLTNIGTNILVPGINNFASSATTTQTAINAFVASPSSATLTAAQTAFTQLALNWATIEPYNFGPMSDNLWAPIINTWPVDTGLINTAISTQANASTQGANAKGLKALEYLLYDANGNQAVLAKYTGGTSAAINQQNYLVSVMSSIASVASALQTAWTGSGNYLNGSFLLGQGNGVGSSVSLMVNSMAYFTDQLKLLKVANPIGDGTKINDGQPHPNLIEYPLSGLSIPAINANLVSMKAVLDGGGTGKGFNDMLTYIKATLNGQNLAAVGDSDFVVATTQINAITPPYATALTTQTAQLKTEMLSLRAIIIYFEVDVAGDCGISITFNDTDGD